MVNLTDLERIKFTYYVMIGGLLLLALMLATYMIILHVRDNRQVAWATGRKRLPKS
jgi:uncharacterized integral membrane protein